MFTVTIKINEKYLTIEQEKKLKQEQSAKGKNKFIDENLGNPKIMINYLISLLNIKSESSY